LARADGPSEAAVPAQRMPCILLLFPIITLNHSADNSDKKFPNRNYYKCGMILIIHSGEAAISLN